MNVVKVSIMIDVNQEKVIDWPTLNIKLNQRRHTYNCFATSCFAVCTAAREMALKGRGRIVAFDLETTGYMPCAIVEIGLVDTATGQHFLQRVSPMIAIDPGVSVGAAAKRFHYRNTHSDLERQATLIHGITDADVASSPTLDVAWPLAWRWLLSLGEKDSAAPSQNMQPVTLLSYGGPFFDISVLSHDLSRYGMAIPPSVAAADFLEHVRATTGFAQAFKVQYPWGRSKLRDVYLCEVGVSMAGAHTSVGDARALLELYQRASAARPFPLVTLTPEEVTDILKRISRGGGGAISRSVSGPAALGRIVGAPRRFPPAAGSGALQRTPTAPPGCGAAASGTAAPGKKIIPALPAPRAAAPPVVTSTPPLMATLAEPPAVVRVAGAPQPAPQADTEDATAARSAEQALAGSKRPRTDVDSMATLHSPELQLTVSAPDELECVSARPVPGSMPASAAVQHAGSILPSLTPLLTGSPAAKCD